MSCPICDAKTHSHYRPFCSKRCADLDLAKWLDGHYAIPADNQDDVEDALQEADLSSQKPH